MKLIQTQCWGAKQVYITFPFQMALHLPQEFRAQNLKWLIMKIQMGFQRPIFAS